METYYLEKMDKPISIIDKIKKIEIEENNCKIYEKKLNQVVKKMEKREIQRVVLAKELHENEELIKNYFKDCKVQLSSTGKFKLKQKGKYNIKTEWFDTIHNYIDDDNIIRKGAVSAYKDQLLVIPINMRDGVLICRGKGNPDWNYSCCHGAGRLMSRSKAKEEISLLDFKNSMQNIFSTCISESTLDESPMAYKPIESIIDNINDTVEIIKTIKPVYNFKAES